MADKVVNHIASDGSVVPVKYTDLGGGTSYAMATTSAAGGTAPTSSTATRASVAAAASNTQLLAANSSRKGATITNDCDVVLYLALGTAAASTSSYTATVAPKDANNVAGYYEVPYGFTGEIRGIWGTSPTGNARITELT